LACLFLRVFWCFDKWLVAFDGRMGLKVARHWGNQAAASDASPRRPGKTLVFRFTRQPGCTNLADTSSTHALSGDRRIPCVQAYTFTHLRGTPCLCRSDLCLSVRGVVKTRAVWDQRGGWGVVWCWQETHSIWRCVRDSF
jgi:hypothetical protein